MCVYVSECLGFKNQAKRATSSTTSHDLSRDLASDVTRKLIMLNLGQNSIKLSQTCFKKENLRK